MRTQQGFGLRILGFLLGLAALVGVAMPLPAAQAQGELFVPNFGTNSVAVYSRSASGNTAPLRTLSGGATGLNVIEGLALDLTNNELFVVNQSTPSVTVYPRTWTVTNTAPTRTLQGAATGLSGPLDIAISAGAAPAAAAIPTLSEWAQIGMVGLLVARGLLALRRRQAA